MEFEKLEPKKPREIIYVNSKEDLIKQFPEISDIIEKMSDQNLPEEEFKKIAHEYNNEADTPPGEVKRYSLNLKGDRVIEVCVGDDGRIGINYELL